MVHVEIPKESIQKQTLLLPKNNLSNSKDTRAIHKNQSFVYILATKKKKWKRKLKKYHNSMKEHKIIGNNFNKICMKSVCIKWQNVADILKDQNKWRDIHVHRLKDNSGHSPQLIYS